MNCNDHGYNITMSNVANACFCKKTKIVMKEGRQNTLFYRLVITINNLFSETKYTPRK